MAEHILQFLEHAGGVINLVGVFVITAGFLLAAGRYAAGYRRLGPEGSFARFEIGLGALCSWDSKFSWWETSSRRSP